ncbi:hypothetical protein C0993_012399 [Termitomyces sp. T159_Od127]|nr:hypothetical protein C0993_012399 [Termitomyces sp. T159_Od127]
MEDLADNSAISKDDPILIYYAGHGAETDPPDHRWATSSENRKVQMLLPHDFVKNPERSEGIRGQGILDMTISKILSTIAENKSNNITVIFDCCHSGSGTRATDGLTVRGVDLPTNYVVPANLLEHPQSTGLRSHVLLAACERGRQAFENQVHGLFTEELLSLLKKEDINRLSYKDIIMRIRHLPSQAPQCEGVYSDRIIFTAENKPRPAVFDIKPIPGMSNQFTFDSAGQAHGVTIGDKFAVHSNKHLNSLIGYVVVSKTTSFSSECFAEVPLPIFGVAYAVQVSTLRLFIDRKDPSYARLVQSIGPLLANTSRHSVQLVDAGKGQDLSMSMYNGRVQFGIGNEICRQYGLTDMPYDVAVDDTDKVLSILRCASDFYSRLDLNHPNKGNSLKGKVHVGCHKLIARTTEDLGTFLDREEANLNKEGLIDIGDDLGDDTPYGFTISNSLNLPLYVALFYFDMSDLSIVQYYHPPTANNEKVDVPLPPRCSLPIGYGDGGWDAQKYTLRENQTIDVGFLKLYVSTKYIDYSSICQSSPFHNGHARATGIFEMRPKEVWSTMIIPIVQGKCSG